MKNLKLIIIILVFLTITLFGIIILLSIQSNNEKVNINYEYQEEDIYENNNSYNNEEETQKEPEELETVIEEISEIEQMQNYLSDYSYNIVNNIEKAYNLLDEEYKNKRFPTIEKFYKFINEKKEQLKNIKIRQYKSYTSGENVIYHGTDENGNYYHITVFPDNQYKIILDQYTLQEDYSYLDEEEAIKKNVEKFILMINSADYTNAYNLLNESFKDSNFPTEQDFINYIKSNWFKRNIIASKEVLEDGTCVVKMRETIATTSRKLEKQFKVILEEDNGFMIEFNK